MPRLFVALPTPPAIAERLSGLFTELAGARWVKPDQLHVTLRFIGSVAEDASERIARRLAYLRASAFSLNLTGVGTFPPPGSGSAARVLWAGVEPIEPLAALKAKVEAIVGPDQEAERSFVPHITLSRLRDARPRAVQAFLAQHAALTSEAWRVHEVVLFRSHTLPEGSRHEALLRVPLAPGGDG